MGDTIEDQQLGCLWSGDYLISVSLSGYINYLDPRSPSKPVKVVAGHNKPITRMTKGHDDSNPTLLTGGSDGRIVEWTVADGTTRVIQGEGHAAQVNGLTLTNDAIIASVAIDDTLKTFNQTSAVFNAGESIKLKAQPRGVDHKGDLSVVVTVNSVVLVISIFFVCGPKGLRHWNDNLFSPTQQFVTYNFNF
jgi:WD40 repeat protein